MNLMKFAPYVLVIVVAGLGMGWCADRDARIAREARAQAALDSARLANAEQVRQIAQLDSAMAHAQQAHEAELEENRTRLHRAERRRLELPPEAPPETVIVYLEEEVAACNAALGNCDSVNVVLEGRLALSQENADTLSQRLGETIERWRDAERRASPGFFKTLWRSLPYMAAAFGAGVIAGGL